MSPEKSSWRDPSLYIERIHLAQEVAELPYTREIVERAGLPTTIVPPGGSPAPAAGERGLTAWKKHLFLCRNRGAFFKPCPGTSEYRCCGYHVLNIGMNCPMDCVYCILQAYLNQPWLTAYVNIDDMFHELDAVLDAAPTAFFRIGTGEFTDSLALERITGLSARLVAYMAAKNNAVLELKTKSCAIDTLKDIAPAGRTILAWSLNSETMIRSHELRAAGLSERLAAAARAAKWGYGLAFHFDPVVVHDNWREGYSAAIAQLFATVPRQAIAWISIGALRYLPSLKTISVDRFPGCRIFHEEFVCGLDGKQRYFRSQREEMYTHIYTQLRASAAPSTCIYFCMESDEIWRKVTGFAPEERGGIAAMLDRAARSWSPS